MTDTTPQAPVRDGWWHHHGRDDTDCILQRIEAALYQTDRKLDQIINNEEKIMSALTDLQSADASLQAEVATFLTDIATALSANDPDIEQVVSDINAQVSALQGGDPANAAPPAPPVSN